MPTTQLATLYFQPWSDEPGCWQAESEQTDEGGGMLSWMIEVTDCGQFDVSQSDRPLLPQQSCRTFERFADAVAYCCEQERIGLEARREQEQE